MELGSLFRIAVAFHLICWAVTMAVLAILAKVIDQVGLLGRVETFLQDAGFAKGFKVDLSILLRAAFGIGFGLVIVAVIATMLLGFFFNGVSGILGGLVITVLEERATPPQTQPKTQTQNQPERGIGASTNAALADQRPGLAEGFHQRAAFEDTVTMWDEPAAVYADRSGS